MQMQEISSVWVDYLKTHEDETDALGRAYSGIFFALAKPEANNVKPHKENRLLAEELRSATIDTDVASFNYYLENLDWAWGHIANTIQGTSLSSEKESQIIAITEEFHDIAPAISNMPNAETVKHCVEFLIDAWECVWDCQDTYAVLAACAMTVLPQNTKENRARFAKVLKTLNGVWCPYKG